MLPHRSNHTMQTRWRLTFSSAVMRRLPSPRPRKAGSAITAFARSKHDRTLHVRSANNRVAGFSLVEVMCAILILGIALAGLTRGITTALSSSRESQVQTAAALIAAGQIEILRAEGFVTTGETEGDCGGGLSQYQWRQSITESEIDSLYEVTVTIENTKSGQAIHELKTLLFDPPPPSSQNQSSQSSSSRRERNRR